MWIFLTFVSFSLAFMVYALLQFLRESKRTNRTHRQGSGSGVAGTQPARTIILIPKDPLLESFAPIHESPAEATLVRKTRAFGSREAMLISSRTAQGQTHTAASQSPDGQEALQKQVEELRDLVGKLLVRIGALEQDGERSA